MISNLEAKLSMLEKVLVLITVAWADRSEATWTRRKFWKCQATNGFV